jgi:hypothetical protein
LGENKEYCRKVIAADSNLKMTHPDVVLYLILSRSLPSSFKPLTYAFVTQSILLLEVKIDMLVEHKTDMRDEGLNTKRHILPSPNPRFQSIAIGLPNLILTMAIRLID